MSTNYQGKPIQASPSINLAARMDQRSNNEVLNIDPSNATPLICYNLENADLFYTKSITSRLGTADVCGGIIGEITTVNQIANWSANIPGVVAALDGELPLTTSKFNTTVIPGQLWIQTGVNQNIYSGNFAILEPVPLTTYDATYDLDYRFSIWRVNGQYKGGGTQMWSGVGAAGFPSVQHAMDLHQITDSGTLNILNGFNIDNPVVKSAFPYTTGFNLIEEGIAYTRFNFKNADTSMFSTPGITTFATLPFQFQSPVALTSGNVYLLTIQNALTSGTNTRTIDYGYMAYQTGVDIDPYAHAAQLSGFSFAGNRSNYMINLPNLFSQIHVKYLLYGNLFSYSGTNDISPDYITSSQDLQTPLINGNNFINHNVITAPTKFGFDARASVPPVDTTSVEFGEVVTLPSGNYNILGAYFFATPDDMAPIRPSTNSLIINGGFSTINKQRISGINYNLGYTLSLSQIVASSGTIGSGNYKVLDRNILGFYSGNHMFNNQDNYYKQEGYNPNYTLEKIYGVFNNTPNFNLISGTDFLLSVKYYDYQTKGAFTDYSWNTQVIPSPFAPPNYKSEFHSFIRNGFQTKGLYSGAYVINSTNDGRTFVTPPSQSGFYFGNQSLSGNYSPAENSLSCGLINLISGNEILGIYDYRIEQSRTQRIIYEQNRYMRYFTLQNPLKQNHVTIFSSGIPGKNNLWCHSTFQNLLLASQYGLATIPQCWDQIYSGIPNLGNHYVYLSGDSTQPHGLQPTFSWAEVPVTSGSQGFTSGTQFQVMLSTEMASGGHRASIPQTITISGLFAPSGYLSAIQLSGLDIFNNTNISTLWSGQYHFDILGVPNATFVWSTLQSQIISGVQQGNIFYLAGLTNDPRSNYLGSSGVLMGGNNLANPLYNINTWNSPSGCFINSIDPGLLTQQVPSVIFYDQSYLTDQVPVPSVKKWIVFKNYLIGAGDSNNPSRLWISQQFAPQIFGEPLISANVGSTGGTYNFYDIDTDDGSPITAMEIWRDRLLVFKYNSFYVIDPTGNASDPFAIRQMSATVGCLGFFTTVTTDEGVYGLSQYGPFIATYAGIQTIGDEIIPYFANLDHQNLTFAVAMHDRLRQQIYWSITNNPSSNDMETGLVFSYGQNATGWGVRRGGMWNCGNIIGDEDNFSLLFTGDLYGQIKQLDINYGDDVFYIDSLGILGDANIPLEFETPWMSLGDSQDLKQLKSLKINCESSKQRLRIDVYFDQDRNTIQYSRYLNMNVPVINRNVTLGETCRTVKLVVTSVGLPDRIKINSFEMSYQNLSKRSSQ